MSAKIDQVVIGLGKSGYSVVEFLARAGLKVLAMDTREQPPYLERVKEHYSNVDVVTGGLQKEVLLEANRIVLSPGVALSTPEIQCPLKAGVEVVGDIQIFADHAKAPIVAITGSNAKSTVTTLVGEMAKDAGLNVAIGGNLGTPALELLDPSVDLYVMELSSFQLETTPNLGAKVATVLNVSPDHLDRYESYEAYWQAKHAVFNGCETAIVNLEDELSAPKDLSIKQIGFSLRAPSELNYGIVSHGEEDFLAIDHQALMKVDELKIKGSHNRSNALAALAIGQAAGLSLDSMITTLRDFPGLEHRCQWVRRVDGVDYFNDSKGTNVGATEAALIGLSSDVKGSIILMAGGDGKGADFGYLKGALSQVRVVIAYGRDQEKIESQLSQSVSVLRASTFEEAFNMASQQATPGDAVLLSPACASFDMFNSFEHRGQVFMSLVEAL